MIEEILESRNFTTVHGKMIPTIKEGITESESCYEQFQIVKEIWKLIKDKHLAIKIRVHPFAQIEYSVTEFFGKETS